MSCPIDICSGRNLFLLMYAASITVAIGVFTGYLAIFLGLRNDRDPHLSLSLGWVSHCFQIILAETLLFLPQGCWVRPMHLPVLMFLAALGGLLIGVPRSIRLMCVSGSGLRGLAAMVLNLTSIFTGALALHVVAWTWGITLQP